MTLQLDNNTSGQEDEFTIIKVIAKEQEEGGFTITVPSIPEIITECEDEDEALDQFSDAYRELHRSFLQEGKEFPYNFGKSMFELEVIRR